MRVLPGIAACATVLVVTAGCGVTEEQTHPGVAAKVADQTLELRTLDQAVEDFCTGLESVDKAQTQATADVRTQILLGWAQSVAVQEVAEDLGVELPDARVEQHEVDQAWDGFGRVDDNYDSFELLTRISKSLGKPMIEIGRASVAQAGQDQVSDDQAAQEGNSLVIAWLQKHRPELNPVFGDVDLETGSFTVSDGLSLPVSAQAMAAAKAPGSAQEASQRVQSLPRSQQCGPVIKAAAPMPAPLG
ncbi:MAG: hypothetical protein L0H31_01510 [Nocardioidaceae bacterium]|nr:hypothetical protein [Nocardioidaceae bacterium]